jgi:N-acetylmuramoyl-L-alanine amidase
VFTLYNPYRLVVDFERTHAAPSLPPAVATSAPMSGEPAPPPPLESREAKATMTAAPAVPSANTTGAFSLARQLGLGVSRIVIDPGHGGHDPGAGANRVTEADLVLDVALRLEKLLAAVDGLEVVLTRRTDVYVPLEERTAIANRAGADLFLSIHANASRNKAARGVETYYLNFASNPEAEAVAARENSAAAGGMHQLPDIIRAIALNDKLDESRDFAELVQASMAKRLSPRNKNFRSLGVKRAPFVVLIGAGMPSVLAEISFVTNREEAALLRTGAYRQKIAQALFDAITQYQRSLKKVTAIADSATR